MKRDRRLLVAVALAACWVSPAAADKFAGAFLDGGAGARALGMGNAYTAVADDASAIYWNPAGLGRTVHHEVLAAHEFRFGNLIDYTFLGAVYQVRQRDGRLGFGIIRLGIDNIVFPDSSLWTDTNQNGEPDPGEFDFDEVRDADKLRFVNDAEWAFFLSYAQPLGKWHLGGSLKLLRQSVDSFSSFGMGVDFGLIRTDVIRNLDLGVMVHDLTGTYLSWNTGRKETIMPVPRVGLAYRLPSKSLRGSFLFSADAELHFDDRRAADQLWAGNTSANLNFGLEFTMQNRLALRLGVQEEAFQAGAGFTTGPLRFNYSVVPDPTSGFDLSQRISLHGLIP